MATYPNVFEGFLNCCSTQAEQGTALEVRVLQLNSDYKDVHGDPVQWEDPLAYLDLDDAPQKPYPGTPYQQDLEERVSLPRLRKYPVPPTLDDAAPEQEQLKELLRLMKHFVAELSRGIYAIQIGTNSKNATVHCQLLEDLQTLKVDQGSGCIIEFPLGSVSKVYRICKSEEAWDAAEFSPASPSRAPVEEHIVVMEFMGRKLPFVFNDTDGARKFLMCMELTIRRAQELRRESEMGPLVPSHRRGQGMTPLFTMASIDKLDASALSQSENLLVGMTGMTSKETLLSSPSLLTKDGSGSLSSSV